jgi:hypothetical protein
MKKVIFGTADPMDVIEIKHNTNEEEFTRWKL